jgi:AraC family transcriptional regulator
MNKKQLVLDTRLGVERPAFNGNPTLSSATAPWSGILLEQRAPSGPQEFEQVAPVEHTLIVQLRGVAELETVVAGRARQTTFHPGDSALFPAGFHHSLRSPNLGEFLVIVLDRQFLRWATQGLCPTAEGGELKDQISIQDPVLCSLPMALQREVQEGTPGGKLYGESMAVALAVHLARFHASTRPSEQHLPAGLSRHQLRKIIDFVQDHLSGEISLAALAAEAGLSAFHFARLFKKTMHVSPHQYVIQRRIERAQDLLKTSRLAAADVALQVGFCDQSHLSVHFKRILGVTPKEFRQRMS